jgi:WD40 repeat protein
MGRTIFFTIVGVVLLFALLWQVFSPISDPPTSDGTQTVDPVADIADLGDDLYKVEAFPDIRRRTKGGADPIILYGVMNAIEQEEVPSQVPGLILFIGEQVDESVVLAAGSAPFLAEPYYFATVDAGEIFVKFYRRLYEGQPIRRDQMVALIQPAKALGEVLVKAAKIEFAEAEYEAAKAGEKEGAERLQRAEKLYRARSIAKEDLGAAQLTWQKLDSERITKEKSVKIARLEKQAADIDLNYHVLKPVMPYKESSIKSIVRHSGYAVKPGDPVIIVQHLGRLQAEALIEEQYYRDLKDKEKRNKQITATIEPTILEKPYREWVAHDRDVTSVAVARDMDNKFSRIVSAGGEDRLVCVWSLDSLLLEKTLKHEDTVVVVATPSREGKNLCLAGCANGDIYVWDLNAEKEDPIQTIKKGHGDKIRSLAFSPKGEFFASGAEDGSIRIWANDGNKFVEKYAFDPKHGVKQCHEDAVTSLHFTEQCRLISAGADKTLRVWRLKEQGAVPEYEALCHRAGNVTQLGVSHDGKWMLFDQGTTLKLCSVKTGSFTHTLSVPVNSTPFDTLALFSPDSSLILTAGLPEGRLQLWRAPDGDARPFEVRQFATREREPVTCAAFSPDAGKSGPTSFAVSASGKNIYVWPIMTHQEVSKHRITDVQMTLRTHSLDPSTKQSRVGFEIDNKDDRFEAGRPATIVIE